MRAGLEAAALYAAASRVEPIAFLPTCPDLPHVSRACEASDPRRSMPTLPNNDPLRMPSVCPAYALTWSDLEAVNPALTPSARRTRGEITIEYGTQKCRTLATPYTLPYALTCPPSDLRSARRSASSASLSASCASASAAARAASAASRAAPAASLSAAATAALSSRMLSLALSSIAVLICTGFSLSAYTLYTIPYRRLVISAHEGPCSSDGL